ncbi:metallophosphoesterase family protein [Metabacillus sp. JX24]|uniref:metallophosphoesterase family protein n=1 Tax=Metabacillus sp. JX24 TaxID=3240759 RepID=UPI003510D088
MKGIRFIHAADLHVDSPFLGMQQLAGPIFERLKESTFAALDRLTVLAIDEKVDFMLIAGDLYDGEDRSLKAQLRLKKAFEKLDENGIPVYVIHGNHDHLSGKWLDLSWPANVHVFSEKQAECKVFEKNGTIVHLYGRSYPERAVYENMTAAFEKQKGADFHIGLLHGSVSGNTEHDAYAPFTAGDLLQKEFDYWALGHIHKRMSLREQDPPILYSGNVQGRNRKETGEKGCYLVSMTEAETSYSFVQLHDVRWEELQLSADGSFQDMLNRLHQGLDDMRSSREPVVVTVRLTGTTDFYHALKEEPVLSDMLEQWNEEESDRENFVWISSVINETMPISSADTLQLDSHFLKDLTEMIREFDQFDDALQPLRHHPVYRKHMQDFGEEEKEQIKKEAETLIFQELFKHRRL